MKTFASRPCAAEADPEAALARAAAAVARFAEGGGSFVGDDVRLAELRRRDGVTWTNRALVVCGTPDVRVHQAVRLMRLAAADAQTPRRAERRNAALRINDIVWRRNRRSRSSPAQCSCSAPAPSVPAPLHPGTPRTVSGARRGTAMRSVSASTGALKTAPTKLCEKSSAAVAPKQHHARRAPVAIADAMAVRSCVADTAGEICYICRTDGKKEGLVRGCACRGTMGAAHLSCLAQQARLPANENDPSHTGALEDYSSRWGRWQTCRLCDQRRHGVVAARSVGGAG